MIEIWVNLFQFVMLAMALGITITRAVSTKSRKWLIVSLFFFSYALGDLYWLMSLIFLGDIPQYGHISEFAWYASYLFLLVLFGQISGQENKNRHYDRVLFIIPVFTAASCIYFMQWGDYINCVICAVLTSIVLWKAGDGLLKAVRDKEHCHPETRIYGVAVAVIMLEYIEWYASCIWYDNATASNPYYWIDIILTIAVVSFLPAVGRRTATAEITDNNGNVNGR